ncbi:MAG: TlpA disulfide reductase family protein [Proteobacteria bacterium]|nr:TlpA disulfide reductase family protein [Pseudomonadota bacterium]
MRALAAVPVAFLFVAGAPVAHAECDKDAVNVGSRMPDLKALGATDEAGKSFTLKALKTPWTLVTIGAAWCVPCKKELPAWDKIAPEFKAKMTFVAVNINHDMAEGKKFNDKLKLVNLTRVYMSEDKAGSLALTMPSTYVVDGKGVVRLAHCGFEKGDVEGEVKKLRAELQKLTK